MRLRPLLDRLPVGGLLWAVATAGLAAELPQYRLELRLEPATHRVDVTAEVTLPAGADTERPDNSVEFALASAFQVQSASGALEPLPPEAGAPFTGINSAGIAAPDAEASVSDNTRRYRLTLPRGARAFTLRYSGILAKRTSAAPQEYARSFAETPGIVAPEGVYLAGSTFWYPYLGDGLVTFELTTTLPPGWRVVAPGNELPSRTPAESRFASAGPVDEISLAGGPLELYHRTTEGIEARVYLRSADPVLAHRYLEATARYLALYRELIGPYPYGQFSVVENFWETGYGIPTYTLLGPQVIRFPFILTSSYPHEILHNWWGNSVFVDYASGNWAEGLTAYLSDHLMQEVAGQGASYRRDTLKRYRDYVGKNEDFPLRDFRGRHSPATEAVGYGKTLMGMHGVRLRVGDDAFRQGLQRFYRDQRGRQARFADLAAALAAPATPGLDRYFDELINRPGAARLALGPVDVQPGGRGYRLTGTLLQVQDDDAYDLAVPVRVLTTKGVEETVVSSRAVTTPFAIETTGAPIEVQADPEFDVFRMLDARETAPSLGQLFGADDVLYILPDSRYMADYPSLVQAWRAPTQDVTVRNAGDVRALPARSAVWVFGADNLWGPRLFGQDPADRWQVGKESLRVGTQSYSLADHSFVLVRRHPGNPAKAVAWVVAGPDAALPALGRKLPHYGKYSWLAFTGAGAENVGKGEWAATDSPLRVSLSSVRPPRELTRPRRAALAELPPAFEAARMLADVEFLADPGQEGRGFGSAGLDAAARYIAEQFAAAGLTPAGDQGGWFQEFSAQGGAESRTHTLRNVVAYLPGTDPEWAGQAVLVTAHYDHLGFGWPDARASAVGRLHPGADDNASGVAVLLELAREMSFGGAQKRGIVFVAFSGEEAGRLGSRHFVRHPVPVPLAGINGVVNLDAVGRLGKQALSVLAMSSAAEWPEVFRQVSTKTGVPIRAVGGTSEASDQQSFIDAGVPGVQLFTGAHADYHRPSDTPDRVDGAGLVKVASVAHKTLLYLADAEERLTARQSAGAPAGGAGPPRRAALGTIPDFEFEGPGVRVEGVVADSAAANAGIAAGDILTQLGGKPIINLNSYNEILKGLSPGDEVELRWHRGDEPGAARVRLGER